MWLHIQSTVPSAGAVCSLLDVGWSGQDTPACYEMHRWVCLPYCAGLEWSVACMPPDYYLTHLAGLALDTVSTLSLSHTHTSHSGLCSAKMCMAEADDMRPGLQYATHQSVRAAKMCCVKSHVFPSQLLEKARVIKLHTSIAALHAFWVLFSSLLFSVEACMHGGSSTYVPLHS
jgi:hypothetical protein